MVSYSRFFLSVMYIPAFLTTAMLAATLLLPGQAAAQSPPPVRDFFDTPAMAAPELSPSGKYLAAKVAAASGRQALTVFDLASGKGGIVAHFSDSDIGHVQWINDEQLLFDTVDRRYASGDRRYGPGLFVVGRDGEKLRQLADRTSDQGNGVRTSVSSVRRMQPWNTFMLGQSGAQDSAFVHVLRTQNNSLKDRGYVDLLRLDTTSAQTALVERPAEAFAYLLDQRGEPRLAISGEKGRTTIWLRDIATGKWRDLTRFDAFVPQASAVMPLGFGPDGTLYAASARGRDHMAIYTLDTATGALGTQPVLQVDGHDFRGRLIQNADKLLGIRYLTDTWGTAWFDPAMKALQSDVDAKLPVTVNLVDVARRPEARHVLVTSYADRQPVAWYVYNRDTRELNRVGEARPRILPVQMGYQQWVSFPARDGLKIPALLTLPAGTDQPSKKPMVVLVHEGPWRRGASWGWDREAQFLASRGYVVLQPEYRGSTGFGKAHFEAGLKQWGLKMQDDLADGTRWAIAQGYADPRRVCIAGAGYGGYATLMGLVRDPDLYRCGVEWMGQTDLKLMVDGAWHIRDAIAQEYRDYGLPRLIGDAREDAAQLQATSPLEQAARIRVPLLMAHGTLDRYVPVQHGTRLRDALRPHNAGVEWIEYESEGHGWSLPANEIDFWTRVEKFLGRHIGPDMKANP